MLIALHGRSWPVRQDKRADKQIMCTPPPGACTQGADGASSIRKGPCCSGSGNSSCSSRKHSSSTTASAMPVHTCQWLRLGHQPCDGDLMGIPRAELLGRKEVTRRLLHFPLVRHADPFPDEHCFSAKCTLLQLGGLPGSALSRRPPFAKGTPRASRMSLRSCPLRKRKSSHT